MKKDVWKSANRKNLLLIALIFILSYSSLFSQTLKIAQVEGNSEQKVAAMILEVVYGRLEIPVEFVELPGQRALELSSAGLVDGEVIRIYELDTMYPSLVRVPTPYYHAETVVFSKNHQFEVRGWPSLTNYRIGIARGMKYYEMQLKEAEHLEKVNDVKTLMQMLDFDRLDIVIETGVNARIQINDLGINSIKMLSPPLERMPLYHYLHEDHKDIVPEVNRIIQEMAESGELESLREDFIRELLK